MLDIYYYYISFDIERRRTNGRSQLESKKMKNDMNDKRIHQGYGTVREHEV